MKKNRKYILILLIIAPAAIWFVMQNNSSTLKEKETAFAVVDTSIVTKVFIADKKMNSVTLTRSDNGWILNDKFNTNTKVVDGLLGTMHRIKVKSPVPKIGRDNIVKRMASIGIKVEVYQTAYRIDLFNKFRYFPYEKLTKVYYVGDVTPDNLGTYMLIEGSENPYVTHIPGFRGFLTPRYSPMADDWKSHVLFSHTLSEILSVAIEFGEMPEESFKVDINPKDGSYKLISLIDNNVVTNYDTLKLLNFLTSFNDLRYESRLNNILSPVIQDSILETKTLHEITLIDEDHDTVYLKTFYKRALPLEARENAYWKMIPMDNDRFYGLANDGEDFVLLQFYTFDKILYPLSHYTQ